jgi:KDO2-lipid IV(A) lauroyltransferase
MKHRFEFALFFCIHRLLVILPERWVAPVSRALARTAIAFGLGRRVVLTNLEIAFGAALDDAGREKLYRANLRASCLTTLEFLRMSHQDRERLRQRATFSGWEHVESALREGRGALMLGGHFGNSELQNVVMALASGGRYHSYTGRQRNPYLDRFLMRLRVQAGVQPVAASDEAGRRMIRILKDNGLMGICGDQGSRRAPMFVPFFGKLASLSEGMATLAIKGGCPVLFSWIKRVGPFQHHIYIKPLTWQRSGSPRRDAQALGRSFLAALEEVVREEPAEYLWMYKRYRRRPASDPDPVY